MAPDDKSEILESKRKRSAPKYWVEIKGRAYARLQYKSENGKYKVKYKPISDKRTAKRVVDEMRLEFETHGEETLQSDKMIFRELAESYKQSKMSPAVFENGIKISGRKSKIDWIVTSLTEYFGPRQIRSIRPRDLENFKSFKLNGITSRGTKRRIASVNRELEVLRAMFNFGLQNGWIIRNPFTLSKGVISKAAEVERNRVLTFEEEARLLSACTDKRTHLKAMLICALDTAMRRGEIFKMRWQDVDLVGDEIYVPQANTKTEDARRVGITPRLKQELELLWDASPREKNQLVFGITDTIKTAWKSSCTVANVKGFRFHDCRHTATTRMIAAGCSHAEVMKITGHSQLKTFLRYLNITAEMTGKVASSLDCYLKERQCKRNPVSESIN